MAAARDSGREPIADGFAPLLRDGVDVYVVGEDEAVFVFLSTRKRISVACEPYLLDALRWMDGAHSLVDLLDRIGTRSDDEAARDKLRAFVEYLAARGILVDARWTEGLPFPTDYTARLARQLALLIDLAGTPEEARRVQEAVFNSRVAIVGVGAIGSWFCRLLPMMGFRDFVLVDATTMPATGVARHASFRRDRIGVARAECGRAEILSVDPTALVDARTLTVRPNSNVDEFLNGIDIVINTADDPYIGYLNVLLSRYVVENRKVLLAAGGFDAHLGCFGELIIPGRTPCADCYARHFKHALRDWKPVAHPVANRADGVGGLASLAAYSASQGALSILRYLLNPSSSFEERAEFLFGDYGIQRFTIARDPNCSTCGSVT